MKAPWLELVLLLGMSAQMVSAHINVVCSATPQGEDDSGKLRFYIGTYHNQGIPQGTLYVKKAANPVTGETATTVAEVPFSNVFLTHDRAEDGYCHRDGPCCPDTLVNIKLGSIDESNSRIQCYRVDYSSNALDTCIPPSCYKTVPIDYDNKPSYAFPSGCPEFEPYGGGVYAANNPRARSWVMAEVTDGKTGKYRLSSTGTNYNFDPVEKTGAWHVPIALGGGNRGGSEMEFALEFAAPKKCDATCSTANNGACEDGGPGSVANTCEWGTDCNPTGASDCEKRQPVTCTTPPTEADFPNLDEASVASCTGTFPGGACSSAKCKKGYYVDPAGLLTCLGAPTEVWERSSFTCLSTPSPPVPPSPPLAPPRSPGYKFNIKEGGCELTFLEAPPYLSSNCPIKYRADGTQQSIDGYNAPAAPPAVDRA